MSTLPDRVSFPNERVAGRVCPACGADRLLAFYAVCGLPFDAATLAYTADAAAAAPTGDVVLALCETCAFVTNVAAPEAAAGRACSLELVAEPLELLTCLREGADEPLAVAVPDTRRMLDGGAFWRVSCDTPSYFTRESLTRVFQRSGYEVERTLAHDGGRCVALEATPTGGQKRDMPLPTELRSASQFVRVCRVRLLEWAAFADDARRAGRRCALWGSGPDAVAFMATLEIADVFGRVVDADPARHGGYLAGTRLEVRPAEDLWAFRPDVVLVIDPADHEAAESRLAALGLSPELCVLN